jgi:hypothetical protein
MEPRINAFDRRKETTRLAEQVRRLDVPGSQDPSQFARDKTELAGRPAALARDAETRLG